MLGGGIPLPKLMNIDFSNADIDVIEVSVSLQHPLIPQVLREIIVCYKKDCVCYLKRKCLNVRQHWSRNNAIFQK